MGLGEDRSIDVSTEHLERMLERLRAYQRRMVVLHDASKRELGRRFRRLEEGRASALEEVHRCRDAMSASEEDDERFALEADLEAAEEALRLFDRWIAEVGDALRPFKRASASWEEMLGSGLSRVIAFLEQTLVRGREYEALSLGQFAPSVHQAGGEQGQEPAAEGASDKLRIVEPPTVTLPPGFQWIRVRDISRLDDLRPEETFTKVPEADVRLGFELLLTEVLPALAADPNVSAEHFRKLDQAKGREPGRGARSVFEAFFGQDHIVLNGRPAEPNYGVTNGRHRIHIARMLGWTHLPAKVL